MGVATGLAWTAVGGDLLFIEVVAVPGKGELLLTGQLGEVMKESAQAALSCARAYASAARPAGRLLRQARHPRARAGGIDPQGRSLGRHHHRRRDRLGPDRTRPVNRRVAMTGEITLRGDVLPIGGVQEKVLAARLAGVQTVIVPKLNQRDLAEVSAPIKQGLLFHFVEHMDEVLAMALLPAPDTAPAPA